MIHPLTYAVFHSSNFLSLGKFKPGEEQFFPGTYLPAGDHPADYSGNIFLKLEIADMDKKDALALTNTVNDKEMKIAELEDKVSALENALKEKEECEDCMAVRKQLIECWECSDGIVGLKRMGEINVARFNTAVERRLMWNDHDVETEELRWFWQNKISDPHWHPFKMVHVNGTNDHQKVVDPEDGYLKMLRIHLGGEACDLVISALKEMLEYNPIMRTPVPELWNFAENRKATLKEAIYNVEFQGQRKRFRAGGGVIYSH